ncbi:MAG: sensor histidine kinase [Caldilinea sp. CFX5]|nr:sensor histidine kinase [Caldilinea sp. CFX5]
MFRSIRWRLVASYTLMTVLAVTLVGVLALLLIERYLLRQERDYLTMNATVVAQQLEPLLRSAEPKPALEELARTTAFLSDVQVRILDAQEQLLVDSGLPSELDGVTWLVPPTAALPFAQAVTTELAEPGVFVQILTDEKGRPPSVVWQGAGTSGDDLAALRPPLVVFRRGTLLGSDPAFWPALPAGAAITKAPWSSAHATPIQSATPLADGAAPPVQRWPQLDALLDRLAFAPQRVVQAVDGEQGVVGYVELRSDPGSGAALLLIRRAFLLAGIGVSLLAVLVALWMSRTLTAPLHELIQATNQMGSGALATRAAVRTQDEIGRLATQFNTMAAQLERSFAELAAERDALRRFVADASHELRTPITALKTFGELLLGPAGESVATRLEFVQESQRQVHRLEWITSALLKLSRLDAGLTELKTETVALGELLSIALKPFAVRAAEKAITLTVMQPSMPIVVRGNAAYLEMALANLLDNGLKFTPVGGVIQLGATITTEEKVDAARVDNSTPPVTWAELWVQDNGPGIAPEDRPYVFDRFYRGQPTGVSNDDAGCGLGLAIVQSIAKAHGGQVTVQSEVGAGSRFVIQVPVAALK